ncbi:ATP-binding cassette domain-containing protein, partial [Klebsiella pneumoniae]|nr:ATP-binding cassette domain-containing protein [Klebsiella pneumoniae]
LILHDVSFAYPARPETLVLDHVSMFFPAGEHTYILGSSGSGKSTVAQLLLGMYKPFSGHIMVDAHNMAHLDPRWLGEHISGVSQS